MFLKSLILTVICLSGLTTAVPLQPKEDEFTFISKELKEDGEVESTRDPAAYTGTKDTIEDLKNLPEFAVLKNLSASGNSSDLFVIKTVVYEIGILTDVGNDTDFDNRTHEQIDISFFDPEYNDTFVDLSKIPIPFQTNVSGVSVTGFIPASFGNLAKLKDGTPTVEGANFPLLPNKQIKVTHNVSTSNKDESEYVLSGLSDILGLPDFIRFDKSGSQEKHNSDSSEENTHEVKKPHKKASSENSKESNSSES